MTPGERSASGRGYTAILASALALLLAGLVVPLAFGTSPATSVAQAAPGSGPARPAPTGARTASDQGVTASEIHLGVVLVDFGAAAALGANIDTSYRPEVQRQLYEAFLGVVNGRGGVGGRRVVADYATVDILRPDTFTAACKNLLDSRHDFAVTNVLGVYGDAILCVTREHRTPYLALDGAADSYYAASGGRLFTLGPSTGSTVRNAIDLLNADGEFRGRTVGLVGEGDYLQADFDGAAAYLAQVLGHPVAHTTISATDTFSAVRAIPQAVARMRAAGVNYVLLQTNPLFAQQFVADAVDQGYRPAYAESDFSFEMAGDTFLGALDPSYFSHARSVTASRVGDAKAGLPEPAPDRLCRQTFQQATGRAVDPASETYYSVLAVCDLVRLFVAGVAGAGVNPTRAGFEAALAGLGAINLAGAGPASFGPNKFTAPDGVRLDRAILGCRCWEPIGTGAFTRARHVR
ncbi:MAG TPA: hypothetical protein VGN54_02590 [Mycobacteriales bacterium]|nr:hypothetical protein [Mycobacteriales bacterium]